MLFEACKYVFWESSALGIVETVGKPALLEAGSACETWSWERFSKAVFCFRGKRVDVTLSKGVWVLRTTATAFVILQSGGSGDVVPRETNQPVRLFHTVSALNKDAVNNFVVIVHYYCFQAPICIFRVPSSFHM